MNNINIPYLPIFSDAEAYRAYAESLRARGLDRRGLCAHLGQELEAALADGWLRLGEDTRQALTASVACFLELLTEDEPDFSPAILFAAKGLELELATLFHCRYIEHLRALGVSPAEFDPPIPLLSVDDEEVYSYVASRDLRCFSLAELPLVLGVREEFAPASRPERGVRCRSGRSSAYRETGGIRKTLSRRAVEFADTLFREDAFRENEREQGIADYLFDLVEDIATIHHYRNMAIHATAGERVDAEACSDCLCKVFRCIHQTFGRFTEPQEGSM